MIFVSKSNLFFVCYHLIIFPAPTRVGDRLIKSKIIPDQARALANALKNVVVKPLKKTIIKKKSFDLNINDQQLTSSHQPIVQSFSNPSSLFIENSDHQLNELSVDSYESTSLITITPPPAKPPRQNDESGSSSSIEINSPPPAKPPRHFSLYKDKNELNILRQLVNLDSSKHIETFTVQPIRVAVKTDVPLRTESFTITSFSSDIVEKKSTNEIVSPQIIQFATNLTKNILQELKKEFNKQQTTKISCDNSPLFSHPIVTTLISPVHSTTRPLMFVSLDSTSNNSPLLDIITTKPTPLFTTSVKITSRPSTLVSSITTVTNSDDDSNSSSTLISDSNKTSDRSISKQDILESNDINTYDNTIFSTQTTGNITPTRSFLSDYDNLHGSYGSLNDDNQLTQTISHNLSSSSTSSSSMTTIYESLDNFPSSSSTATSPTYVSAVSTFNTGGTRTPSQRLNSDISDEDLIESFDFERSSQGTQARTCSFIPGMSLTFLFSQLAWQNKFCFSIKINFVVINTFIVSTPIIEIIEDNSEPIDEDDMTFLTEVLAQYHHNLHHQGLRLMCTHVLILNEILLI